MWKRKYSCWLLLGCSATLFCACSQTSACSHDLCLQGSAVGVQAYNDGIIGMAKTMVEPKSKSLYMSTRKQQETQRTARENNPGFWQMMADAMGGGAK